MDEKDITEWSARPRVCSPGTCFRVTARSKNGERVESLTHTHTLTQFFSFDAQHLDAPEQLEGSKKKRCRPQAAVSCFHQRLRTKVLCIQIQVVVFVRTATVGRILLNNLEGIEGRWWAQTNGQSGKRDKTLPMGQPPREDILPMGQWIERTGKIHIGRSALPPLYSDKIFKSSHYSTLGHSVEMPGRKPQNVYMQVCAQFWRIDSYIKNPCLPLGTALIRTRV